MSDVRSAIKRVREGKAIRIDVDGRRIIYIDAERYDEDPGMVEHFNLHLRYTREGEMGYYRHIDGLELVKTLQNHEFRIVPKAKADHEIEG